MKQWLKAVVVGVALTSSLTGCVAALFGGATAGVLSATDRRTTGAQADDKTMEFQVSSAISEHLKASSNDSKTPIAVKVISYNRQILLMGTVPTEADRQFAERVAKAQTPAKKVYNYIGLAQERTFGDASGDAWTTSKVRTMLLNAKGYNPNHVKIVTYDDVTYIFGILTPEEQAAVNAQVSTTAGVQKVVTLYETFIPQY